MKKILLIVFRLLVFTIAVGIGFVQSAYAEVNIGDKFGKGTVVDKLPSTFAELGNPVLLTFFVFAGLTVFAVLIYGGISYIMGAGGGDGKRIAEGQQAITWGLIGLSVMVGAFWIVRIVEVVTGLDFIEFGSNK